MLLKSVAVFVDQSAASATRARYAVKLALRHGAHLIGIFVAPPGWDGRPADSYVRGTQAIQGLIERYKATERAASQAASQEFEAATRREDVSFEFRVLLAGDAGEQAKLSSLHVDLAVVGHSRPSGLPEGWTAESLLLATGVPFLIVPDEWSADMVAKHVIVGWNASREARRAIADSLPLLTSAQSVSLVVIDAAKNERHGEEPGADIALYLSRHGVKVTVAQIESANGTIGETMLRQAASSGADLIVLGAYSHNRTFEIVSGGVTRFLLEHSQIPILIAH